MRGTPAPRCPPTCARRRAASCAVLPAAASTGRRPTSNGCAAKWQRSARDRSLLGLVVLASRTLTAAAGGIAAALQLEQAVATGGQIVDHRRAQAALDR